MSSLSSAAYSRRVSKGRLVALATALLMPYAAAQGQTVPPTMSSFFTDPTPVLMATPSETVLYKELSGYGNYGVPDRASDILYTGQAATWHFPIPSSVDLDAVQGAFFRVGLIADDHYGVPLSLYNLAAWTNGAFLLDGPSDLPHGAPYGQVFDNWVERDYGTSSKPDHFTITLQNSSTGTAGGDWYAVDWIELHLPKAPAPSTPEPGPPALALASAVVCFALARQRMRHNYPMC